MADADEPTDQDPDFVFLDLPEFPAEDETPAPSEGWLSALGQMAAAFLAVVAIVAVFVGLAAVLRRILPWW